MNQLDKELQLIKAKVNAMWELVELQVASAREALETTNPQLARKVVKRDKKVNDFDLKIDRMCENFFALYNPVAVDLRWMLATLKINANLERIGDSAEGIAQQVCEVESAFAPALLEATRFTEMYDAAQAMLADAFLAFDEQDTSLARQLIQRDKLLNKINGRKDKVLVQYMQQHPDQMNHCLKLSSVLQKLERIGDQVTNISEEVIFYVDAKMIKHKSMKKKTKDKKNKPEEGESPSI
ncbi:phosphate signaling complex protein PhoU [Nibribacter ruber]|uniref:Phosphate-specific transport system accessory protein PhoU n=1 Tax=Nibribacter ruber TaxID=2698458 RepID=A0A6P1NSE5_9BACT|nr:phosphate signaling complex protein PhoU [Nibribacter ruber]QHL85940.1 phosphate signaling complex protein PhoU [Nibribacter ruber]